MGVTPTSCQFIHPHIMVPILQSPGLPERAGEARRADSASTNNMAALWQHNFAVYDEAFVNLLGFSCYLLDNRRREELIKTSSLRTLN